MPPQRRMMALRSFRRFAALEEWTARDLALAIDLPKLPQRLPKSLEDAERERPGEELYATTPAEKLCSRSMETKLGRLYQAQGGSDLA